MEKNSQYNELKKVYPKRILKRLGRKKVKKTVVKAHRYRRNSYA